MQYAYHKKFFHGFYFFLVLVIGFLSMMAPCGSHYLGISLVWTSLNLAYLALFFLQTGFPSSGDEVLRKYFPSWLMSLLGISTLKLRSGKGGQDIQVV